MTVSSYLLYNYNSNLFWSVNCLLDGINSYDMGELQRFHFKRIVSKRVIRRKNLDVMCTREKEYSGLEGMRLDFQ